MQTSTEPAALDEARAAEVAAALAEAGPAADPVGPVTPAEHAARRTRCAALLAAAGLDALVVEPGATQRYLSGVDASLSERLTALVVLADGSCFWLVPGFEVERVRGSAGDVEVLGWQEHEYAFAPLASALRRRRAERVAVEPALRAFQLAGLALALGQETLPLATGLLRDLRGCKDEHELALLRSASERTQRALLAVSRLLRPGLTALEIGALLRHAHRLQGMSGHWDLVLFGADAAEPHGSTGPRRLERGDLVLVDTGAALHGYQSDTTRTWVFDGAPSERVAQVWHAVHDAQRRAFEALAPGRRAREADAAARAVFAAAGFGGAYELFTHRVGHGIGMEGHEAPYLDGGSEVFLAPGMVFTDEPGLYVRGELGVRIEDVVAITAGGATHFGQWQAAPTSPAG